MNKLSHLFAVCSLTLAFSVAYAPRTDVSWPARVYDAPSRVDKLFVSPSPVESDFIQNTTDRTTELQALLDSPTQVVDLGGQTWYTKRLTLSVLHSGKTIQNGMIKYFGPDGKPQYYLVELIQGRRWYAPGSTKLIDYPAGQINLKCVNVVFDGAFEFDSGFQPHNETVADEQGKSFNLIGAVSNKAGNVEFVNCTWQNGGNSGWGGSFESLTVTDCQAIRVTKHGLAMPGWGGARVKITRYTSRECGNGFDLSNPDKEFRNLLRADIAMLEDILIVNPRGRTKFGQANWIVNIKNIKLEQDDIVSMNLWPGLDSTYNLHQISIDGFVAKNFLMGFATLGDSNFNDGIIDLRNATFYNCFHPVKVQQRLTLSNATMDTYYNKYVSGTAIESNITTINQQGPQYWATICDKIHYKYDAFNLQYGTSYVPLMWIPKPVRNLMKHP